MIFHFALLAGIIILYTLLCARKNNSKRELLFLRIVFVILFVLVATREMTTGNDTQMYLKLFEKCATQKWQAVSFNGYFEGGYLIFNVLTSYISTSPRFFMIVMSAIFNFSIYSFIKKNSKNYLFSVLMYICLLFLYTSMTMMRQFMAISIILLGFDFVKNKKIIPFILTIILATTFHSSAWLALLIYPMANLRFTRKRAIALVVIGIIASLSIGTIFDSFAQLIGRTNYYADRAGIDNLANLLYAITFLCLYAFARYTLAKNIKIEKYTTKETFYLYSLLLAFVTSLMGIKMDIISRTIIYFSIFSIISIPNLISGHIANAHNRKIVYVVLALFLLSYSSTIMYLRPEWNSAYRYKTCIVPKAGYICSDNDKGI